MIKNISFIQNFGPFVNYLWNCRDFQKFNLIFGLNYSGKTTLSRIFQAFETGEIPTHYETGLFSLTGENNISYTRNDVYEKLLDVRVFNEDFVNDHFRWDEDTQADAFFTLGKENIELTELLSKAKDNKIRLEIRENELQSKIDIIETKKNKLLTEKAKSIKRELHIIQQYTRTHLNSDIKKLPKPYSQFVLSQRDAEGFQAVSVSSGKREIIAPVGLYFSDVNEIFSELKILLADVVESKSIQELVENPELNQWIRTGLKFHTKDVKYCKFCGQVLPEEKLRTYLNHFSDAYTVFCEKLDALDAKINNKQEALSNLRLPDTGLFYPDLSKNASLALNHLAWILDQYRNYLVNLSKYLALKRNNLFRPVTCDEKMFPLNELGKAFTKLSDVIDVHNQITMEFDRKKEEAAVNLKNHLIAEFLLSDTFSDYQCELGQYSEELEKVTGELVELQNTIDEITSELNEGGISADKINRYLKIYFGKEDVMIQPDENNSGFALYRHGERAYNLSSGEKTAVSFAYFIAKLGDKNTDLKKTLVFIDDPVSSLDKNHIFNVFSFIKEVFDGKSGAQECACEQLFIATHNRDFFEYVYQWFTQASDAASYYLVQNEKKGEKSGESVIMDLPETDK